MQQHLLYTLFYCLLPRESREITNIVLLSENAGNKLLQLAMLELTSNNIVYFHLSPLKERHKHSDTLTCPGGRSPQSLVFVSCWVQGWRAEVGETPRLCLEVVHWLAAGPSGPLWRHTQKCVWA